ncbi:hypothetical protein [Castellaniella ginsengisoli]|uniref:Uncharacterized protein n=1 Tax=Castellaniella ginsengisoli TaxID=546114 RepID=A0AB39CTU9_9BURK
MADPHWYVMSRIGLLTLCADEADARESAGRFDKEWPDAAPHRAVQLVAVEDMDALLAERDRMRDALASIIDIAPRPAVIEIARAAIAQEGS